MFPPIPIPMWAIKLALYALLVASVGIYSYRSGVNSERLEWEAKQTEVLQTQLAEIDRLAQENAKLVKDYQVVDKKRRDLYAQLQTEVGKATNGNVCFTPDAWRLWNQALGGQSSMPRPASGTAEASARTDTTILGNALKNFEQYKECRDLHGKLIEWRDKNFGSK